MEIKMKTNNKSFAYWIIAILGVVTFVRFAFEREQTKQPNPTSRLKTEQAQCPKPQEKDCFKQCANMTNFQKVARVARIYGLAKIHIDNYYKENPLPDYTSQEAATVDLLSDALIYTADPEYFIRVHKEGLEDIQEFLRLIEEQSKNYESGDTSAYAKPNTTAT